MALVSLILPLSPRFVRTILDREVVVLGIECELWLHDKEFRYSFNGKLNEVGGQAESDNIKLVPCGLSADLSSCIWGAGNSGETERLAVCIECLGLYRYFRDWNGTLGLSERLATSRELWCRREEDTSKQTERDNGMYYVASHPHKSGT
ncbi:uncharacterized protein BDR25DRAFT_357765 [Lindgomyces ingoldianus]|uniref:Uncharacterized protein n=1 Tax=Lindgomyces ingoldianus TaxID=673940 RepID=A0ACB6QQQ3_9PLEO|nr:uncharacterized protein BDR25DRAFT_357765 [Lindgomyces ingoldianus]KAF2468412.1 hypothetical protein BDR25DRAFT_357765 [Lindgomyces ingoldianus]